MRCDYQRDSVPSTQIDDRYSRLLVSVVHGANNCMQSVGAARKGGTTASVDTVRKGGTTACVDTVRKGGTTASEETVGKGGTTASEETVGKGGATTGGFHTHLIAMKIQYVELC